MTETRDRLAELYAPKWRPWLIPLCSPFQPHRHGKSECQAGGKVPIERGWNRAAAERAESGDVSKRLEQLERHLDDGGNVGLALPPGILVLDADDPESAAFLVDRYPRSPFQRTDAGGHLVLSYDETRARVKARTKVEIAPGFVVDIRVGGRSQIVVEPSIHWRGSLYEWGRPL